MREGGGGRISDLSLFFFPSYLHCGLFKRKIKTEGEKTFHSPREKRHLYAPGRSIQCWRCWPVVIRCSWIWWRRSGTCRWRASFNDRQTRRMQRSSLPLSEVEDAGDSVRDRELRTSLQVQFRFDSDSTALSLSLPPPPFVPPLHYSEPLDRTIIVTARHLSIRK